MTLGRGIFFRVLGFTAGCVAFRVACHDVFGGILLVLVLIAGLLAAVVIRLNGWDA